MSEPTEQDLARWAKWEDLRARQEAATTDEERKALALEQEELEAASIKEMLQQEMSQDPQWFWLSFRDVDANENLGVAIVEGGGIVEAALNAKLRKCNPGGEVLGYPLEPEQLPAPELRNRLLSEHELVAAGLIAD
jgi:hypothetical protein